MKRTGIILSIFLTSTIVYCQGVYEGLLSTRSITGGTARSLSMSGSFGALGGDASVASTNPAGLGVMRKSVFTISPGLYYSTTNADYDGISNEDYEYKFVLDNLSYIFSSNTGNKEGLVGFNFGLGYNKLNNFSQRILIGPKTASSSLLDEFTYFYNINEASEFYEWLAEDANLIFYDTVYNEWASDFTDSDYGQVLEKTITRDGYLGEYHLSFASNISNILYVGATIGFQRLEYSERTSHFENDVNDLIPVTTSFDFRDQVNLEGKGVNMKLGVLVKPIDFLRLGAAIHLPTKMKLDYNFYTDISSVLVFDDGIERNNASSPDSRVNFQTITPLKGLFSMGLVFGKYGLLNVDYEYVDYTKMRIRSSDESFSDVNRSIQNELVETGNLKIGGEFNLGMLALRAGFAHYGDPFAVSHFNSGQFQNSFSGGLGYRNKDFFIDFGMMFYNKDEKHSLYYNSALDMDETASFNTNFVKILTTIGFKF